MNIVELASGNVMQTSEVTSMKPDQMTAFMAEVAATGKKIKFVDSIATFFSIPNLLASVDKTDVDSIRLIAEKRGLNVTEEEFQLISQINALKTALVDRINRCRPAYQMAKVPDGWTVESKLSFSKSSVRRKGNEYTVESKLSFSKSSVRRKGNEYTIGIKTLEKIWNVAYKVWANEEADGRVNSINASGYNRNAFIRRDKIEIGCQSIQRFEIEQVALHLGWSFG